MEKGILCVFAFLAVVALSCTQAENQEFCVDDRVDIMSEGEKAVIEETCFRFLDEYGVDTYVVTVSKMKEMQPSNVGDNDLLIVVAAEEQKARVFLGDFLSMEIDEENVKTVEETIMMPGSKKENTGVRIITALNLLEPRLSEYGQKSKITDVSVGELLAPIIVLVIFVFLIAYTSSGWGYYKSE